MVGSLKEAKIRLKERIKRGFSRSAHTYNRYADLQKESAKRLMDFGFKSATLNPQSIINNNPHLSILDIGCGTGILTSMLKSAFSEADITGCDISYCMTLIAKNKFGEDNNIHLSTGDAEDLPFKDESFDLIASNLTYQWAADLFKAFLETYRVLKKGGIFVFSTLGEGSLKELRESYIEASRRFKRGGLPPFVEFADNNNLLSLMETAGFLDISIKTSHNMRQYKDMWELLRRLKLIGAGNPCADGDPSLRRGGILKEMAGVYEEKFKTQNSKFKVKEAKDKTFTHNSQLTTHNSIYATYEVVFVYGKK